MNWTRDDWNAGYEQAFELARRTKHSRDMAYNTSESPVWGHFAHGAVSLFQHVWGKTFRLRALMEPGRAVMWPEIEDSLVDLLNYTAFLLAWVRQQQCPIWQRCPACLEAAGHLPDCAEGTLGECGPTIRSVSEE